MESQQLTPVIPLSTLKRYIPDDEITPREIYNRKMLSENSEYFSDSSLVITKRNVKREGEKCIELKKDAPFDRNLDLSYLLLKIGETLQELDDRGLTLHPYTKEEFICLSKKIKDYKLEIFKYRQVKQIPEVSSHMLSLLKEWCETSNISLLSNIENYLARH